MGVRFGQRTCKGEVSATLCEDRRGAKGDLKRTGEEGKV